MRNAALTLGLIAGIIGIIVGLFGYGFAELTRSNEQVAELGWIENPTLVMMSSFFAPLLAIAGGGMAKVRALVGGILLLLSAGLFYVGFGFNVATMFPIGFAGLAGILALAAGRPDEPKAHF